MIPSNFSVILATLALLGTAVLLFALTIALLFGLLGQHPRVTRIAAVGAPGLAAGYAAVLVLVGAVNPERTLPVGTEKYFCELDCHLAYSVVGLRSVGQAPLSHATTWAVTVRTRFDERTIASFRPRDAPLSPGPRQVGLVGTDGRSVGAVPADSGRLAGLGIASVPLETELRPGESYTTTFLFDLPGGTLPASLDLEDADLFPNHLLIGHEQSPLHGRVLLGLPAPRTS